MQKIAVYGGTFNPIHNGHLHLARHFDERIGFDRVIFIPTNVPPHKAAKNLASAKDRLAMCRLAAQTVGYEVSDLEIKRGGPSYTADTLRDLHQQFPNAELYLLMGEDMFITLSAWKFPERILKLSIICAAPRSEDGLIKMKNAAESLRHMGGIVLLENIEYLPVSSTMVREAVQTGQSCRNLVPPVVADYIRINHLYEESVS